MNIKGVFQTSTKRLFTKLNRKLKEFGYMTDKNKLFLYGEGNIPILLVAHIDTVHHSLPTQIFYDKEQQIMWSPQGLGADDRAGVYAIMEILKRGYRPHVLFTDLEESGGVGADAAARTLPPPDVRYIIELDRQGIDDSVFYECANPEFEAYINEFGFKTNFGSFSDISFLCPNWGIAGVNLSIGYFHQHTKQEILCVREMFKTIEKVCTMLEKPPKKTFEYIEEMYFGRGIYGDLLIDDYYCTLTRYEKKGQKKTTKLRNWSEIM